MDCRSFCQITLNKTQANIVIVQYQMETLCGECGNNYSKACGTKQHCIVHNQLCFACVFAKCKQPDVAREKVRCFVCVEECNIEEAYYEMRCENYLCRKEFQSLDFANEEVTLPCGCLQLKEHVVAFMSSYCLGCFRKMADVDTRNVRLCRLCVEKDKEKKEEKPISGNKQVGPNLFFGMGAFHLNKKLLYGKANRPLIAAEQYSGLFGPQLLKPSSQRSQLFSLFTERLKSKEKTVSDPLPLPSPPPPQKQSTDKLVLDLLAKDLEQAQTQLNISQFTRIQLRKLLMVPQRDKECSICIQLFTHNTRKPMMICMQQHLICEPCFKEKLALANCPLCSEAIQRDKVRPSRERMRTLQLQNVMIEKYESKVKRYSTYSTKNITELRYKFQIKDAEVQTDLFSLAEIPVKPEPKMKRAYGRSVPKNGEKKVKQQ